MDPISSQGRFLKLWLFLSDPTSESYQDCESMLIIIVYLQVCLPARGVNHAAGKRCTVTGYGYMGEG